MDVLAVVEMFRLLADEVNRLDFYRIHGLYPLVGLRIPFRPFNRSAAVNKQFNADTPERVFLLEIGIIYVG